MSRVTWALSCHLPCTWNRRWRKQRKQFWQYSNFAHFEIMNYPFILQFINQTFIRCLQYVIFKISITLFLENSKQRSFQGSISPSFYELADPQSAKKRLIDDLILFLRFWDQFCALKQMLVKSIPLLLVGRLNKFKRAKIYYNIK